MREGLCKCLLNSGECHECSRGTEDAKASELHRLGNILALLMPLFVRELYAPALGLVDPRLRGIVSRLSIAGNYCGNEQRVLRANTETMPI